MQTSSEFPGFPALLRRRKDPSRSFSPAAQLYIREIGGTIEKYLQEHGESADKPEWLALHEEWLRARGLTLEDAVRSNDLWIEELKATGKFPVASIETANIEA